jgi:hypothetical protein
MNGTASVGVDPGFSHGDHVHPTDTTRYAASNPSGFQTAAQVTASLGAYLPLAGGTVSGSLSVTANLIAAGGFCAIRSSGTPSLQLQNNSGGIGTNINHSLASGISTWANVAASSLGAYIDATGNLNASTANATKPSGGPWVAASDERIKTVGGEWKQGLDDIIKLRPVTYAFKGNDTPTADPNADHIEAKSDVAPFPASPHYHEAKNGSAFVGLIAQEVETIFPGMVARKPGYINGEAVDDLRTLDTGPLIFALVNAVKTLAARVEALESASG